MPFTSHCDRYDFHRIYGRYPEDEVESADVPAEEVTAKVVTPKATRGTTKTSRVAETKG